MVNFFFSQIFILLLFKMADCYFKCNSDGIYPDKTDCWVYHICDGGTHSVRACEEDLFFNPKTGLCDWPMNVDCKQPESKTTPKPITKLTSTKTTIKATKPATKSKDELLSEGLTENICSSEDYGYLPHPTDCRKYIYCQEGTIKVFTCQGGLFWKQSDGNCVWPSDSDCPSVLAKKTTYPNPSVLISLQKANSQAALRELFGAMECPIETTGFYPSEYDCSAYHFCNNGFDQVILCEPGLFYRHDKQVCDWPINASCSPKCPSSKEKFRFVDPKSCCRYYECVNGRMVVQLCQYPMLFDVYTKQCMDYSKVKCGIRKDCTSPCHYFTSDENSLCEMVPSCSAKPQGIYLDQNRPNCQFFYTCRDNRVFNHSRCANNQRFNQFEGRCMASSLVACNSSPPPLHSPLFNYIYFFIYFYFLYNLF